MPGRSRHTYVPAFDGLRGVAILPVPMLHVGATVLPNGSLLRKLTRGWYRVELFFVLSGFLITRILAGEIEAIGTIDLKRFYGRRVLRLGPAYLSMLAAVTAGALMVHRPEIADAPKVIPALLTYTYNYQIAAGGPHFDVIVELWSLCVEEQFYLMWPAILRKLGTQSALRFAIGAVVALSLYRIALYLWLNWGHLGYPTPRSSVWIYFATETRIGVILLGCAAALSLKHPRARLVWRRVRQSRIAPDALAVAACICAIFITGGTPSSGSWRAATFGYTLGALCTAAMIGAIFIRPSSIAARVLSWRPLVGLGRISYGVYLFHAPIAWAVLHWMPLLRAGWALSTGVAFAGASGAIPIGSAIDPDTFRFLVAAAIVSAITSAVAALHYRYVERWFLSLRTPREE